MCVQIETTCSILFQLYVELANKYERERNILMHLIFKTCNTKKHKLLTIVIILFIIQQQKKKLLKQILKLKIIKRN